MLSEEQKNSHTYGTIELQTIQRRFIPEGKITGLGAKGRLVAVDWWDALGGPVELERQPYR